MLSLSLKFCEKNLPKSERVLKALQEKYPDLKIEVAECLDVCGLCNDVPFVLRNNGIVGARNDKELYLKLENGMKPMLLEEPLPGTASAKAKLAALEGESSEGEGATIATAQSTKVEKTEE